MSTEATMDDPPVELRVHGVGGPQARKMLGRLDEEDLVTLPPFLCADGSTRLPCNGETRFARAVDDPTTEAYEWGGLTTGSWVKALWVLYLPFTMINAGGWAHSAPAPNGKRQVAVSVQRAASHAVAVLASATYVLWLGYLMVDLAAVRWRDRLAQGTDWPPGAADDAVAVWLQLLAPIAFLAVVGVFVLPQWRRGRFEEVGAAPEHDLSWTPVPALVDPSFFAHAVQHRNRNLIHVALMAVVAIGVVVLYIVGIDRLGVALLWLAALQTAALVVMGLAEVVGRIRHKPSQVSPTYPDVTPGLWARWPWIPMGTALAMAGTFMAHAAFAGAALLALERLEAWPSLDDAPRLEVGPELQASDVFAWTVLLVVLGAGAIALRSILRGDNDDEKGLVIRLARRARLLVLVLLLAVAVPVAVYFVLNGIGRESGANWGREFFVWYDGYEYESGSIFRRIGSFVLVLLPVAVYGVLRGSHDRGVARVVGNAWDVLTFWPRRFHPLGAPPYGERAVPELRARIERVLHDGGGMVLLGHSQGSVVAAAALTSAKRATDDRVFLMTFGSPLGTLYAPTWPAYIPPMLVALTEAPRPGWVNHWRPTDPIGGPVPLARNYRLRDPRTPADWELSEDRPPGERPVPWNVRAGHGRYLSDPGFRDARRRFRARVQERRRG